MSTELRLDCEQVKSLYDNALKLDSLSLISEMIGQALPLGALPSSAQRALRRLSGEPLRPRARPYPKVPLEAAQQALEALGRLQERPLGSTLPLKQDLLGPYSKSSDWKSLNPQPADFLQLSSDAANLVDLHLFGAPFPPPQSLPLERNHHPHQGQARRAVKLLANKSSIYFWETTRQSIRDFLDLRLFKDLNPRDLKEDNATLFLSFSCSLESYRRLFRKIEPDHDLIKDILLERALNAGSSAPWALAHYDTSSKVVDLLSDDQRIELMKSYRKVLVQSASLLKKIYGSGFDFLGTNSQSGLDSTSWNQAARAFNQAGLHFMQLNNPGVDIKRAVPLKLSKVPILQAPSASNRDLLTRDQEFIRAQVQRFQGSPLPWEIFSA